MKTVFAPMSLLLAVSVPELAQTIRDRTTFRRNPNPLTNRSPAPIPTY